LFFIDLKNVAAHSEKQIKSFVLAKCKKYGIRYTNRGNIAGLFNKSFSFSVFSSYIFYILFFEEFP
jgi:hypothetical protein